MRRITVILLICCASVVAASVAPSAASAAFNQCPPVDRDTSCQFLFTVTDTETTVQSDPSQGPFEGIEDALIGIQNNSSKPLSSIPISAEENLFGFENDGICSPGENPLPAGCVILSETSNHEKPTNKVGEKCPSPFLFTECGFPEAEGGGEPKGVTFPEGVAVNGFGAKGNPVSGYEGPTSWFSNISVFGPFPFGSGVVNFSPAIPPGGSTYFSLESPPVGGFGGTSTLTTTLSGGGQSGASITVLQGTPVTDSATLGGANAGAATGSVSFSVFTDPGCKVPAAQAGAAKIAGGTAGPSAAISTLAPGKYYWQASYGGSLQAQPATSACGSEVLTVLAPTSTTTVQTTGKAAAPSLTVPLGTPVKDQAFIAGPLAKAATGAVSYVLFKDSKCTIPAAPGSAAAVVGGVGGLSAPLKPSVGKYYWRASYTGDAVNAPSVSACGGEVLVVAFKAKLGLAGKKGCVSKRKFPIHPKGPRGANLVSFEEFINGILVKKGRLSNRATSVNLVGLPKGTYEVELVAKTRSGKTYEDTRTFHTCVPKKHKKGKKGKKGK